MEIKKIRLGGILLPSNVLMAPLAGYTCYPFRMLAYEMGAGLCFTEMSSANERPVTVRTSLLLSCHIDNARNVPSSIAGSISPANKKRREGFLFILVRNREKIYGSAKVMIWAHVMLSIFFVFITALLESILIPGSSSCFGLER